MKKIFLSLLTVILIATSVFADEIKFTASAPNVVELGEQFRLTYSVNSKGKNIKIPALNGFRVLMGPSTSSSMSTQIINGKVSSNSSYSYTYVLLAEEEGKFDITPATITIDGETKTSNSLTIEVVEVNKTRQDTQSSQSNNTASDDKITENNLFVKVDLDRKSVYMGEHIVASIKVYTRLTIAGFGDSKFPSFNGFLSQEVPTPGQISLEEKILTGPFTIQESFVN
ncbi:BatD family protein [Labilibaculum antarcticum]|uniref:Protein BatD n=1 Tax=Labilibaculum antarcticum TaxID=1717717 RepID=A0A1Y1CE94_9BACT|nr:BatD family protein [Labilibaculum antarcticum]BAX78679.1 hypothetical protein ALGA_0284 [Labilibaculum antarcticum]